MSYDYDYRPAAVLERPRPAGPGAQKLARALFSFREPLAFLGRVRMGDVTLDSASRDQILAAIDTTDAKAQAVQAFKDAHPYDLATVLGANLGNWNNYWALQDDNSVAVSNLYSQFVSDKNSGVPSTWTSVQEGAFSGWKYAVEQLFALAQNPPLPPPTPPPPPPPPGGGGTTTTANSLPTAVYIVGGVTVLGILGGLAYWLTR